MANTLIRRVSVGNEHDDQKWLVLEGYIEGLDHLTKRVTINTSALADGSVSLAAVRAKLIADVEEYHARWLAVQEALEQL